MTRRQDSSPGTGAALFARYAYPPSALGYCGPPDAPALFRASGDARWATDVGRTAAGFEGAWPYLELIAETNEISDPLDVRVVEAYWLGGPFLDRVRQPAASEWLRRRFVAGTTAGLSAATGSIPSAGLLHHSFQVLFVYPWLGIARAGVLEPAIAILDQCRIRRGIVMSVRKTSLVVRTERLLFEEGRLAVRGERLELVHESLDGSGPALELEAGDEVSLHWNRVCDRLDRERSAWLDEYTRRNLEVANLELLAPHGKPRPPDPPDPGDLFL